MGGDVIGTTTNNTTLEIRPNGTTTYYAASMSDNGNCVSPERIAVTTTVNPMTDPTVEGDNDLLCGETTTLTASGSGQYAIYRWYSDAECTNLLYEGSEYSTPELSATTTYYVKGSVDNVAQNNEFSYNGSEQSITLPAGSYVLEAWGAQGGASYGNNYQGGKGGYAVGTYILYTTATIYINVGGQGANGGTGNSYYALGGYNGGGNTGYYYNGWGTGSYYTYGGGGGGATHIALMPGTLNGLSSNTQSVLLVAGGGGGAVYATNGTHYGNGGYGGGVTGGTAYASNGSYYATGGTQSSGGTNYNNSSSYNGYSTSGSFGLGGRGSGTSSSNNSDYSTFGAGGGGGGYYGGAGGNGGWDGSGYGCGGGGGSSFVSNLVQSQTIAGNSTFLSPNGVQELGHTGNGYVRITSLSNELMCNTNIIPITVTVNPLPTPEITSPEVTINCGETYELSAMAERGDIVWFTQATGGESIGTTTNGTSLTVSPEETTTYYAEAMSNDGMCVSPSRDAVTVTVVPTAAREVLEVEAMLCGETTTLSVANPNAAYIYNWYSDAECTQFVHTGTTFTTPILHDNTTYYVKALVDNSFSQDFSYTGGEQTFVIPQGINELTLEVWGAQGGQYSSSYPGGKGGYASGTLPVSPGDNIYVYVGQQPTTYSTSSGAINPGGYNGGGDGKTYVYSY